MWELLQKLEKLGWKPYGKSIAELTETEKNVRLLTSRSSGLWQFVCGNEMVDGVDRWTLNARQKSIYDKFITSEKEYTPKMNYEYRLIESALCDEDKLEQFLVSNIKIGEK